MKIEIFTWDGSYATKKNKIEEINEFMKDKNIHSVTTTELEMYPKELVITIIYDDND